MSLSETSMGDKSVAEIVAGLEKQAENRADGDWHEDLKNRTKIALEKINAAFDAKRISAEESLSLKQRVYSVQDMLMERALW